MRGLCSAIVAIVAALGCVACDPAAVELPGPPECRVERVSDGDTIRVSCLDESVRLLLVDAPEIAHDGNPPDCFGDEAAGYLRERLPLGTIVELERGVLDRDRFGRYLRYIWLGGELINESLVAEGYAVRYRDAEDTTYRDRVTAAEARARERGLGLWSACGG